MRCVIRAASLLLTLLFTASVVSSGDAVPSGVMQRRNPETTIRSHRYANDEVQNIKQPGRPIYGDFGLSFEANRGQTDSGVKFLARGSHHIVFLTAAEAVFVMTKREPAIRRPLHRRPPARRSWATAAVVRMIFVGANPDPQMAGETALPGKANYFIGNAPAKWRTNVPTYARVRYRNLYHGIDLIYHRSHGHLEYDFVVQPGADPARIALRWEGAGGVEVDSHGDLVLRTAVGVIRQPKPVIYQEIDGARRSISGGYEVKPGQVVGFHVGGYDAGRPLVIDPTLSYSTYLGGGYSDTASGIAVDLAGNAYVTGETLSADFPIVHGMQPVLRGVDAFVAKLNVTGSGLVYSTYLGGSNSDAGRAIAVDSAGHAVVTGWTISSDFPLAYPFQPGLGGRAMNAFVTMLDATGSHLVYSSYLGGSNFDEGYGIALDAAGNAYVTGETSSPNFPTTLNVPQPALAPPVCTPEGCSVSNAFVTKVDMDRFQIVYSTYLGGSGFDRANAIALDAAGNAYVTGVAQSNNFPTRNALQPTLGGFANAFVTKVNAAGSAFEYSTYLGGNGNDSGQGIAVDTDGNAYITGYTFSTNFPLRNALQSSPTQAFVTKLSASGSTLVYSTYLGCPGDPAFAIAVDSARNAYVTGNASCSTFPSVNAVQPALRGQANAYVAKINAAGSALLYSTYLGGSGWDNGFGIAVDWRGSAYVTGDTTSPDFPAVNAFQSAWPSGRSQAGFVAKIGTVLVYTFQGVASGALTIPWSNFTNLPFTLTVTVNPDAIFQSTQPCTVPSGKCTLYGVPATSVTINAGLVPPQPGGFGAQIASPMAVFVNQTYSTLGLARMASGRVMTDVMDLQSSPAFATYNLAHAIGPVGPFFARPTALGQFNCSFGCVTTRGGGTLSLTSVSNVTFTAY